MKVFAMNDCDWMAGESLESVKTEYLKNYAAGLPEEEALDEPHELSDEEMARTIFVDEDGSKRSFRQQLDTLIAGQDPEQLPAFPCLFASTEY